MIQILDNHDRELYRYQLKQGENKFGSDQHQCQYIIKQTQPILFNIVLADCEVFLLHYSVDEQVKKDSTLQSSVQVALQKQFPYEMNPMRFFYFKNYKFRLLVEKQLEYQAPQNATIEGTQILEEFSGTMVLDDIIEQPTITIKPQIQTPMMQTTQVLSTQQFQSTMIVNTPPNGLEEEPELQQQSTVQLQQLLQQFTQSNTSDASTQTEPQIVPKQQQSVFGAFKFMKHREEAITPTNHQQESQNHIQATVVDQDLSQQFQQQLAGTVLDDDLDRIYAQSDNKKSQAQLSGELQYQAQTAPSLENNHTNMELNDLFGNVTIQQPAVSTPVITQGYRRFQRNPSFQTKTSDDSEKKATPIKQEPESEPKITRTVAPVDISLREQKQFKFSEKQHIQLKRITDQDSNDEPHNHKKNNKKQRQQKQQQQEIQEEESQQFINKQGGQPSQELQSTNKHYLEQEKGSNNVPNKRRGLRKLAKLDSITEVNRVAFSGFNQNEIPTEDKLAVIGLELIDDFDTKFDVLILKEAKRTLKFLAALIMGASIVTEQWLTDSIRQGQQQSFDKYIPDSDQFVEQFSIKVSDLIVNRDDYLKSNDNKVEIFEGQYYVDNDVNPSKREIEFLITLGGGNIVRRPTKKSTIVSDGDKDNAVGSDQILDQCMFV